MCPTFPSHRSVIEESRRNRCNGLFSGLLTGSYLTTFLTQHETTYLSQDSAAYSGLSSPTSIRTVLHMPIGQFELGDSPGEALLSNIL